MLDEWQRKGFGMGMLHVKGSGFGHKNSLSEQKSRL